MDDGEHVKYGLYELSSGEDAGVGGHGGVYCCEWDCCYDGKAVGRGECELCDGGVNGEGVLWALGGVEKGGETG